MIVIGDVHGCYKTLLALYSSLPKDDICFVGDLIDRGPKSRSVVQFVIDNGFDCVCGNHEKFMIDSYDPQTKDLWVYNGGDATLSEYKNYPHIFDSHMEWMKKLPLVLEYGGLIVSHSSCAKYIWSGRNPEIEESVLWERDNYPKKIPELYNIFGHTPQPKPLIKDHFACIDTGCFDHYNNKYGVLTAIQYPEMKMFQQKNVADI